MSVTTFVLKFDPKLEIPYQNNKRKLVAYVPGYRRIFHNQHNNQHTKKSSMKTLTKRNQDITMQTLAWIFTRFSMIVSRLSFFDRLSFVVLRPTTNDQRPTNNIRKGVQTLFFICALLLGSVQGWGQQNVFSRSGAGTGNWWDSNNPWYYETSNNDQNRPDNNSNTRNFVKIGHNSNLTMTTNGAFFTLNTLDFQSGASSQRTINGGGANTGISLTGGIYNASGATHIINADLGIDASTVQLHNNSTGGMNFGGAIFINANTVQFGGSGSGNFTVTGVLQGTGGSLTKTGSNTLNINTAATYTGTTTINQGTLTLGVANALPVGSSAGVIRFATNANSTFNLGLFNLGSSTTAANSAGALDFDVNTTINLGASGTNSYYFKASNGQTWDATTITINNWTGIPGVTGTGRKIFIGSDGTGLTAAQLAKISFNGFTGAVQLSTGEVVPANIVWSNNSTLTAWYTNTNWTPNTASNAWGTSSVAQFQNTGSATTARIAINTSSLSIGAVEIASTRTRTLTIDNSSNTTGTLTLNGASINGVANTILRNASNSLLTLQDGNSAMGIALGNSTANVINTDGVGGITISSIISGTSRNITKVGSGTLTLSGPNTYTGSTSVEGGILNIQNAQGTGTTAGGVTVSSGAALELQGAAVGAESLSLNGSGVSSGGALRFISGTNSWGGLITLAGDARINADAGTNTIDVSSGDAISGNFNLTVGGAGSLTIADPIANGAGTLTKDGNGTLTLSAANNYTGATTINAGTLTLGVANALPVSTSAGTIRFANGTPTLNLGLFNLGSGTSSANSAGALDFDVATTFNLASTGSYNYYFKASGSEAWAGSVTINNWYGIPGVTGSGNKIFIGNSANLTATQLTKITFAGYTGCTQLSTGEIVPTGGINPGFENTPPSSNGWTLESGSITWTTEGSARSGSSRLSSNVTTTNARKAEHTSGYSVVVPSTGTNYVHVIGYALEHTNTAGTDNAYVGATSPNGGSIIQGLNVGMTTSWQRMTASGVATNSAAYYPVFYSDGNGGNPADNFAFDDIIIYTSTSSSVDLTKPNAPLGLAVTRSGGNNNLAWSDGTDNATNTSGIEGTLILRASGNRTSSITALSNALLDQAYYSTSSSVGPTTISDGTNTWTVISNGTSSGSFSDAGAGTNFTYAVFMRDKAFNYSSGVASYMPAPPTINSTSGVVASSPGSGTSGYVGNTITINGTNLDLVTEVRVGGSGGTVVSIASQSATSLTFTAINAGGQIYVSNLAGNTTSTETYTNLGFISNAATDWNNASTWLGGAVPAASSAVTIAHAVTVNSAVSAAPSSVTINSTRSLTFGASGTLTSTNVTNNGSLVMTAGGTLTIASGGTLANGTSTFTSGSGTVSFAGSGTITGTISFNNIQVNGTVTFSNAVTVNGTLRINANGAVSSQAPRYGASSTLEYNTGGNYGRSTEWNATGNGTIGTTQGYPNNISLTGNTALNFPNGEVAVSRGIEGNLAINSGSSLYMDFGTPDPGVSASLTVRGNVTQNGNLSLGNANGGDLYIGGNYTEAASGFSNNFRGRAVIFNGTGTQVLTKTGGGTISFAGTGAGGYFIVDKTGGSVQLNSSTATSVSVTQNAGDVLQIKNTGSLDLNGQTFTLSGAGGNILTEGGARNITSTTSGARFVISGDKTVRTTSSGTLVFGSNVTVGLSSIVNFGVGLSTVNGTLEINSGGGVTTNAPVYGSSSLLKYNFGGVYGRNIEWSASSGSVGSTVGYPNDVQVSNNTTLDYPNTGTAAFSTNLFVGRDLTIDAGSSLYMDYGSAPTGNKSSRLTVARHVNNAGNLSLGDAVLGDIYVGGNWTRTGTVGSFNPNSRAVFFNGAGDQTITRTGGSGISTFDFLNVDKSSGNLIIANNITCNRTLTLTSGDVITGSNKVTISSTGDITAGTAASHIVGNLERHVATGSNVSRVFPIGDGTNYIPVTLTMSSVTTAGTITLNTTASAHPNIATIDLSTTKNINRHWTISNSSTVFTGGSVAFNYVAGDLQGGATAASLLGAAYASSTWSYPSTSGQAANTFTCTGLTSSTIQAIFTAAECATPSAPAAGNASKSYTGIANTTTVSATPGANQTIDWYLNETGGSALSSGSTTYIPTGVNAGTYTVYAEARNTRTGCVSATRTAVTLTINKVSLTITASDQTVTYGTAASVVTGAGAYTVTGFVNNETASVISGSVTYTTTYTATTNAGTAGVTITPVVSGLSATNYSFTAVNGTITINKANSTITATGTTTYTYTGTPQGPTTSTVTGSTGAVTYSYSGTGSTTYTASATRPTNAGTYQVVATVATDVNFNAATSAALAFTINQASLTITAANQTVTYGTAVSTVTSAGTYTATGFVNGETASVISGTATYTTTYTATTNAGTAGVTITPVVSGLSATNYSFTAVNGTITINKANSTITATGTTTYTYTGAAQGPTTSTVTGSTGAVTYSYSGTGSTTYAASATRPTNAGTYQVVATVATDVNFNAATSAALAFTINKASLTITAGDQTVTYGTAVATVTSAGTYTATGFVNGETASVISGTATYTTNYTATTNAGTAGVTITPVVSGLTATNYSFTAVNGTITINKANSTITATGTTTYTYTGAAQGPTTSTVTGSTGAVTYSYSGTGSTTYAASATRPTNAGTYQVIATVAADVNYNSATSAALAFTINQKALTITGVTVTSKVYDKTNTATFNTALASLSGVVSPDVVTIDASGATGTFSSVNAGSGISVTATGFSLGGAAAANYSVTQPTGLTGTITPRPVTLTGTRVYDGTNVAQANDITISNNLDGASLTLTGSGTLDLEDVGTRTISAPTALTRVQSAVGNTGSGPANSFTVTMPATPTNGNTLIAVIATRNTGANTVSSISQTGTTWTRATQSTNSNGASNTTSGITTEIWYAQARSTSNASVTITLNASVSTRVSAVVMEYSGILALNPLDVENGNTGSSTSASTSSITTSQANELLIAAIGYQNSGTTITSISNSFGSVTSATTTSSSANNAVISAFERIVSSTGTYSTVATLDNSRSWAASIASFKASIPSGNAFALGGAAAGNYTLTGMTGTMTVTQKALSITAPSVASKEYDGMATSGTVTVGTLSGVVSPETLGVTATGTYADANVGTGKTATIVYTLSDGTNGGKATNYSLANGSATGNITAKALTITANDQTKCQGSTFNFAGTEFTSSGLVSGQSISGVTFASAGAAPGASTGTSSIVPSQATGATITNYNISYFDGTMTVLPSTPATVSIVSSDADNTICPGTSVTFTATPVNGGASPSYQWKLNGANVGTNSTTYTTSSLANGDQVMVVMSYAATACLGASTANSNAITTTVNPNPTDFTVTGGGGFCAGGSGTSIQLSGSQSGVSYQLVRGGSTNVGSPVSGTGTSINFGAQTTAGTYTVVATNSTTSCTNNMTGSVTITVNPIPSAPGIGTITQPTCTVPTGSIQLTGLPATGTWTVTRNPGGVTTTGTGTSATFNSLPDATSYTFTVTTEEGCQSAVSATATLNARPAIPDAPLGTDASRCGAGTINLFANPIGSNQTIDWYATASGGTALLSGNTQFTTPSLSVTTTYYAQARFTTTGCVSASRTAVVATISATPTITASSTATGVAYGVSSTSLNYSATSGSPTLYSITWNSTPTNNFVAVSDATLTASPISISIPTSTAVGTYTGTLTVKTIDGCISSSSTFTLAISAVPLTITGITANNKVYDGTTTATVSGSVAYSGLQYGESFVVAGTPVMNFNTAAVGNNKPITVTGYSAPSSNYTLTQPSFTANITAAPLTISIDEAYKAFNTTLASPVTGVVDFTADGLVEGETIGSITITYGTGAASSAAIGTYTNTAVPSAATGGTFTASNYSITYVPNNIVVGNYKFAWITGNWNAANMWSSSSSSYVATSAPASTDIVQIRRQNTVTVNVTNAVCGRIELGGTGANTEGFLTFASTGSPKLTVSGQVVIGGFGSTNNNRRGEVVLVSGATLEAEDIVLTRSTVGSDNPGVLSMATGGTLIANTITVGQGAATWTPGTGTVILANSNNLTLPSSVFTSFNNLTINAGKQVTSGVSFSVAGTMTVNGIFTPGATTHVVSGASGTLTGSGEIDVTLVSATALTSQFSINTRTLSNMTVEYRGAGNQSMAGITYGNLQTAGSGTKTLLGTTTVNGNLNIGVATTLNGGGQNLSVRGDWINSGTFTHGSGTVTFSGTGTQTLTGNSNFNNFTVTNTASNISLGASYGLGVEGTFTPNGTSFGSMTGSTINFNGASGQTIPAFNFVNLTISGGGTKTLSGAVTVSNVMSLTSGDVTLGNNNLTLSSANGLSGGSASSHIITNGTGLFRRTIGGAAAYLFPMGSATDYNPVTYTWSSAPGITQLDASYITAAASIGSGLPTVVFGCTLASEILNNGYWSFTPTGTLSNNPSVTVSRLGHTNAGLRFSSHGIVRRANTSADWEVAGVWVDNGNSLVSPANTGSVTLTQSDLSAFGEIAVAKGTGTGNAFGLWTGASNGNAENSANWGCGTVPSYTVDVVIPRNTTYQPTIFNTDLQAKSVTINSGATVRITGPRTLSIAADGYFTNNGTFNSGNQSTVSFEGAGSVSGQSASTFNNLTLNGATTLTTVPTINGNLLMNTGASVTASPNYGNNAVLVYNMTNTASTGFEWTGNGTSVAAGQPKDITVQNSGTITLSGNRSVPANFTMSNGVVAVGNNTLSLYGDVTVTGGSFTSGATGTVLYNKQGNNQTVPAGSYGNLTLNNFSKVLATSGTIGVAGTFTPGSASHTTTGSTISFNGSSAQSIPAFNYNNLIVAGSNTKTAATGLTVTGNVTISSTFDAGTFSHAVAGNWINNGTFTHGGGTIQFNGTTTISGSSENTFNNVLVTGSLTAPNANMNVAGNWTINGGTFTPGTGTVTLNNTQAPQSIGGTASAFSFNNLTVANTGQTITLQGSPSARKTLNVGGNMTLNGGAFTAIFTDVNMTSGNWTNNGATFTWGNSKVTFNGTNGNQFINGTAATQSFARLEMNKPGRTLSLGGSTTRLNVTDTFALVAGTYDAGTTDSLRIGKNWIITGGTFTPGVSTVAFDGELAQVVPAQAYHKLSIIGSGTKTANGNITINDELNISNGKELDLDTYQLVDGGALNTTGSGTLRTKNTGTAPLPNGKTWSFAVAFEGAAEQTLSNGTYNGGVTINNNSNGARMNGNVTAASVTLSSGDLSIQSNTLTLNGSFNGSSNNALRGSATSNLTVGNGAAAGILYFRNSGTHNLIKDLRFMSAASGTLGNRLNVTAGAAAGKVKVEANSSLASNGNLVLKSDTLGTAYVDEIVNCTTCTPITGEVEVERAMPNRRTWRLVTIPVTGSYTLRQQLTRQGPGAAVEYPAPYCNGSPAPAASGYGTMITGHSMSSCTNAAAVGADLITTGGSSSVRRYTFLNNTGSWASNNTTNAINFNAAPDQDGYLMFIRGDRSQLGSGSNATTFRFKGTLKQGNAVSTQTVNASYGVMSNPYAAPINVDDVFNNGTGNASKFDRNVWVWDGEKVGANGLGGYRSLSYDGVSAYTCGDCGTNAEGQQFLTLNSGQAFMVQRKADVTTAVSMTIKEEDKVSSAGNIATMRTSASARLTNSTVPSFRVQLHRANGATLESFADATTARFNKLYQANANEPYDVYKYNNNDENISLVRSGKYLVIESRPVPTTTDTLYLPFWSTTNRGYALSIQTENFSTPGLAAELIDSFTNTRTQVPLNGSTLVYPFSVTSNAASKSLSRFRVVFTQGSSLPVNFVNVRAQVKNGSMVQVDWEVANEENLYQYEVERSADGKEFTKMAEQTPRNVATNHTYSWMDVRPNTGNNFYRIKALDNDGTFRYSATVKVNTGGAVQDVRVYPTTLDQPTVSLELTDQPAGIYEISMSNALGQMIFNKTLQHTGGNAVMTVDLSSYSLTAGVHFFTIKDQDGNKKSVKLMVKK